MKRQYVLSSRCQLGRELAGTSVVTRVLATWCGKMAWPSTVRWCVCSLSGDAAGPMLLAASYLSARCIACKASSHEQTNQQRTCLFRCRLSCSTKSLSRPMIHGACTWTRIVQVQPEQPHAQML